MNTSKCACCFKDVLVFSHYCAFVWTGLSDTSGREFFENGEKKISLFNHKRRRVSRENLRTQAFLAIYNTPKIAEPLIHQTIPPASSLLPPPPGYCGTFASLVSPGDGAFANFALPGGRAFANPRAMHSRAFGTHAFSYQDITTQNVLLEKSRLAHLSRPGINCRGL